MNQLLYRVNESCNDLELVVLTQDSDGNTDMTAIPLEVVEDIAKMIKRFREVAAERDAEIAFNGSSNIDPIKEVFDGEVRS